MSSKLLPIFFIILIHANYSMANELCTSDKGYMTMSDKTKILSNLENKHGNNTILVDQGSEFNFTCHNNQNTTKVQTLFSSYIIYPGM